MSSFYVFFIVAIIETHYLKHILTESGSFINVLKVMVHQFKKEMVARFRVVLTYFLSSKYLEQSKSKLQIYNIKQ